MEVYGFSEDFLTFSSSHLKRQKQSININNAHSMFQILLSGVPEGSIPGPMVFSRFL